jgi:hypothetical protein
MRNREYFFRILLLHSTHTFLRPLDFFFYISQIVLSDTLNISFFDLSTYRTFLRGLMQP